MTPSAACSKSSFALLVLLAAGCGPGAAPDLPPRPVEETSVRPGANERFLAEDLDVDEFVGIFEGESREIAREREAIAATLGLTAGDAVADVGAGTGLFLDLLARAVGPDGAVYAVDLSPGFVEHLEQRAQDEGLASVSVVLCTERSVELAPASVDVVFLCDTYHHVEYPSSVLWSIYRALRPGGRLVIVDFERIPGVSRDWILGHVRAGKETVLAEIEAAGFRFEDEPEIEGLEENYVLRFRRP